MIINALAELIYALLDLLLVFDLPSLPDSVVSIVNQVLGMISQGVQIITAFTGSTTIAICAVLLNLLLLMHSAYMVYNFVCFILRKIPMLDVEM